MPPPPRSPCRILPPRTARGTGAVVALAVACATLLVPPHACRAEADLTEKILDSKYRRGDYGVYLGWHDPADWQFDEHASWALPTGVKVRFRWLDWLRIEGDVTYYRRSSEPAVLVSVFHAPSFDGLMVSGALQVLPRRTGLLRPYAGGGPVMASLGNDFLVFRPEVRDADPNNPDQFALATWSRIDLGWQALGGVDFYIGKRVSPFVEFRHLFGKLELDRGDVTIGAFGFDPRELHTVPDSPGGSGVPHSSTYDWSGPIITAGLKVRF